MSAQKNAAPDQPARKASPGRKSGQKSRKSTPGQTRAPRQRSSATPELTAEAQAYDTALKECTPQERIYVQERVLGATQAEAAKAAGYKCANDTYFADMGRQLSQRLRVKNALEAGYALFRFSTSDLLDDIDALRLFDRSQVEREVKVREVTLVERPAEEVVQELLKRERVVEEMLVVKREENPESSVVAILGRRLDALLTRRLELEESLAVNPQATTFEEVEQLATKRVFDYDLAREKGLLRFVKSVKPTKYGDVIELYDWVEGLDRAAKAKGLYKDSHELTGADGEPLQGGQGVVFVLPNNGRDV